MKLKKLHISNVASIQEAEIDFDAPPLSEERLFLITGDTGTGKSTIIDCLCLALYGTTPRMKAARRADYEAGNESQGAEESLFTNDPRQLLRRGCGSADVSLTFDDKEGTPYVATWHVHRARNRANGALQDVVRTLCTEDGVTPSVHLFKKTEIDTFITQLIGLDVNQFFRTVVLAQGKFAEFLNADDNEKSLLLEKMMGIEIYSQVGKKIYEITSEKKRVCDALTDSLKDITLLQPEELAAIEEERTQFKQEQATIRKQHDLAKAMHDAGQQIAALQTQKPALQTEYGRLSAALDATIALLEEKKQKLESLNAEIAAESPNSTMYAAIGQIKSLMGRRHKALASIHSSTLAWEQEKKKLPAAEETVNKKSEACKAQKEQVDKIQQHYNDLKIDEVNARKDALNDAKAALNAVKGQIETIDRQETAIGEMRKDLDGQQQSLARESATLEAKKTIAVRAHDELERHKDWNALLTQAHKSLHQGDTCPVCGHVIDTLLTPKSQSVLDELQTRYQEADQDWKDTQTRITATEKLIKHLQGQIKKAVDEQDERRKALAEQRDKTGHEFNTTAQADALIADIDSEVGKLNDILAEAQNLAKTLQQEHTRLTEAETAHHDAVMDLTSVKNNIKLQTTAIATSQQQHDEATTELEQLLTIDGWQRMSVEQAMVTVGNIEKKAEHYQQMTTAAQQLERAIELMKNSIPVMEEAKSNIGDALTCDIEPQGNQEIPDDLVSRWNTLENNFLQWHTALRREQQTAQEAQRQLADLMTEQPDFTTERLAEIIAQTAQRDEQLNDEISQRTARLNTDEENKKLAGQKRELLANAQTVYTQWSQLNEMLGNADGAKFRKIALSYILEELLAIANEYLRRFNDRYELEAQPGSLTILVRDLLQGDKTAVTTLSGGESFMVSLALALALARMTGKVFTVDTIFIDEGFGTLSANYLSGVMETLNHLYDLGGRRVGIISHVEALKERIATQIHVYRDPRNNTLSHIRVSG